MQIPFSKYAGSGNDFILIDNRDLKFKALPAIIKPLCDRKRGVGADGIITLERGERSPYRMRIFNSDGTEAEMCGNGLRCFKKFLEEVGVSNPEVLVETKERLLKVSKAGLDVKASMGEPTELSQEIKLNERVTLDFINTGVPHAVKFVTSIDEVDVEREGSQIRHHPYFGPRGTNANFVEVRGEDLYVRTYERGVEGETLACGTGIVASALLSALKFNLKGPLKVFPKSLEALMVEFNITDKKFADVTQTGPAQFIFQGSFFHGPQNG